MRRENLPAAIRITNSDPKNLICRAAAKQSLFFIIFKGLKKDLLITGTLFITLVSCSKKNVPAADSLLGLDYYPTAAGKFVVYEVDSTVYTDLPQDTISYKYRIKEKMADSFTDNQGQPAIRLERYIKKYNPAVPYDSMAWSLKEVWMVNATNTSIQVVEGNVRYTKLVFPVREKMTWNGNAFNTLGEWQYMLDYAGRAETINNNALGSVLRVKQKDFKTLISYQGYFEKYAKNIGLVYRQITDISSNNIVPGVPVDNRIESGLIYTQTLINHGHE